MTERNRIIDECIEVAVRVGDDMNPANGPDWYTACDEIVAKLRALKSDVGT